MPHPHPMEAWPRPAPGSPGEASGEVSRVCGARQPGTAGRRKNRLPVSVYNTVTGSQCCFALSPGHVLFWPQAPSVFHSLSARETKYPINLNIPYFSFQNLHCLPLGQIRPSRSCLLNLTPVSLTSKQLLDMNHAERCFSPTAHLNRVRASVGHLLYLEHICSPGVS